MFGGWRTRPGLVLGLWVCACSTQSTTPTEGKAGPPSVTPGSEAGEAAGCESATAVGVWARLAAQPCDWELRDDGDALVLQDLSPGAAAPYRGEAPAGCRAQTCVYHGVMSVVGPMVLAIVPSSESEMPTDVQLGLPHEGQLVFTSVWEGSGPSVVTDLTRVGPAHALAPFVCDGALALLAVPRLDAGEGALPPQSLRVREGRVDAAALDAPAGPVERDGCTPVELPVP